MNSRDVYEYAILKNLEAPFHLKPVVDPHYFHGLFGTRRLRSSSSPDVYYTAYFRHRYYSWLSKVCSFISWRTLSTIWTHPAVVPIFEPVHEEKESRLNEA